MSWTPVVGSSATWTATTGSRAGQFVPLAPSPLDTESVDFCVKVNDRVPLYVVDANPLRVWPNQMEAP